MRLITILLAVTALAGPAQAQPEREPPIEPYPAVAVAPPEPFADAGFETFRRELAAVAARRVYAELARLTVEREFFWERDFKRILDRERPGVENLATAVRLEHGSGDGWKTLGLYAAEASAVPLPGHLGVICAPAPPRFDEADLDRLIHKTWIESPHWAYPVAEKTVLRAAPDPAAPVIETLGRHFVRLLRRSADGTPRRLPALGDSPWMAVVSPGGKSGFVAPGAILALASPRLCYAKDSFARWRITGYVGPGS